FQAEDGIRDLIVTGVQTCALPICGNGGTELLPAIQQAMAVPRAANVSRSVVLVTDGYISGERGVFDYIRENLNQSNVFAFGIGRSEERRVGKEGKLRWWWYM